MIGAIIGDIIGAKYEFNNIKTIDFDLFDKTNTNFTDDTVMTLAVAKWIISENRSSANLEKIIVSFAEKYRNVGYGELFYRWLFQYSSFIVDGKRATCRMPYNSYGNGSAMRASPIGFACKSLEETLQYAKISAEITHNHPEGIKGAQAVASAIFLAKTNKDKKEIKDYIETTFGYNLSRTCDEIRPMYEFNETCQGTVPEAIYFNFNYRSNIRGLLCKNTKSVFRLL